MGKGEGREATVFKEESRRAFKEESRRAERACCGRASERREATLFEGEGDKQSELVVGGRGKERDGV